MYSTQPALFNQLVTFNSGTLTLMPVTRISWLFPCSSKVGAELWIGACSQDGYVDEMN